MTHVTIQLIIIDVLSASKSQVLMTITKGIRTWYYVSNGTKLEAFVCDDCKEKRKEWIYQAKYPS